MRREKMGSIFKKWKVKLKTITPIHVGSGEELISNIDFIYNRSDKLIYVPNIEELSKLSDISLEEFSSPAKILESKGLWQRKNLVKRKIKPANGCGKLINRIREHIHDGFGRPYIPGSSIKGAIRTALLWGMIMDDQDPPKLKADYRKILENLGRGDSDRKIIKNAFLGKGQQVSGDDAKYDIMKAVKVSDCYIDETIETWVYSVAIWDVKGNGYGWWVFRRGPEAKEPCEGTLIFVEAIPPDTTAEFEVTLDLKLLNEYAKKHGWSDEQKEAVFKIWDKVFDYFDYKTIEEEEFFANHNYIDGSDFYNKIGNESKSLSKNQSLIRIAWGGGWRFMTGNWIPDDLINDVRKKYKLGKVKCPHCGSRKIREDRKNKDKLFCANCGKSFDYFDLKLIYPFPKTRRFAIVGGKTLPLGWAEITWEEIAK